MSHFPANSKNNLSTHNCFIARLISGEKKVCVTNTVFFLRLY